MQTTLNVVVWCCVWWYSPTHSMDSLETKPLETANKIKFKEYWFDQYLDHFTITDNTMWKQRYFKSDIYYQRGGPVFLWIGDQVEIGQSFLYNGAWTEYAKSKNAYLFEIEHRFYGKSHPTKNLCTKNLVYLNSEQALSDLANFIVSMGKDCNFPPETKWVAFGASIGASLAAWLRMTYSHLVHAAVCSSSQLLAKVDFKEYFNTVENILSNYSSECVSQIKEANRELNYLLETDKGAETISNQFHLCENLNKNNEKDVSSFFKILADNIGNVVKQNNIIEDNLTYEQLCDIMVDKSLKTSLDRYAVVNEKILSFFRYDCINYNYNKLIKDLSNKLWTSDAAVLGNRQSMYQICTEFGGLKTSNEMFGNKFNLDYLVNVCSDIFGDLFNLEFLNYAVNNTNIIFGGLDIMINRIIFVEGLDNPFNELGLTYPRTKLNKVITIKGGAMSSDIYAPTNRDTRELEKARMKIADALSKYLKEDDYFKNTTCSE